MKEWFKARNIWGAAIATLSDEEAGRLAKAIWAYTMNGEIIDFEGAGKGTYAMILMTLQKDNAHDNQVSKVRSRAVEIREEKKNQMISNDIKTDQMISNDIKIDNKNKNKIKNKNIEQEQDLRFERFWSAYPRHVNKQSARKAFAKINPSDEVLEIILRELERQKKMPQWTKDGGQYIPHPATWLNGARWEDEITEQRPAVTAQAYGQRDYSGEQEDAMRRMLGMVT